MKFSTIAGAVLDMDGVLWRGDQPLPAMQELFAWLAESNIPYALATNNSSKTQADYVAKLTRMEINDVPEERIITSATATVAYLSTRYGPGTPVYVLGMAGLQQILTEAGFDVITGTGAQDPVEVVVVGIDFDVTYDRLKQAALHIRAGAEFIGTNPDKTFPAAEGLVPGAGSLIAAVEAATDQDAFMIGKPAEPMFQAALAVLGTAPAETLMVGDRLNTDIQGAQATGMQTALLLTGVTTSEELATADIWPDVAYEGLPELLKAWAGDQWYLNKMKIKRGRV